MSSRFVGGTADRHLAGRWTVRFNATRGHGGGLGHQFCSHAVGKLNECGRFKPFTPNLYRKLALERDGNCASLSPRPPALTDPVDGSGLIVRAMTVAAPGGHC